MSVVISHRSDFIAFSLFFIAGFHDMFMQPHLVHSGFFIFICTYALIVLLLGIPAYAEESSSLMDAEGSVREKHRSADISYPYSWAHSMMALMQNLQRTVASSYDLHEVVIAQIFIVSMDETARSTIASIPVDEKCSNTTFDKESDNRCMLMRLVCDFQTISSNKQNKLYYSTLILSIIVFVYAATFGRALRTYCTISRFYLAVIGLFGMVQMIHFLGANANQELSRRQPVLDESITKSDDTLGQIVFRLVPKALDSCFYSMGLSTFGVAVIGSRTGRKIKQYFVAMAIAVCLTDLGVWVSFSMVNALRESVIFSKCNMSAHHDSMGEFHDYGGMIRSEGFSDRLRNSILATTRPFDEASGRIPWTMFLPMHILLFVFFLLRITSYFVLTDLQAVIAFKNRVWCILLTSVLRMALLIFLTLLLLNGNWTILVAYMKTSANITFLVAKLIECVSIHRHEGFEEYFKRKRSLILVDSHIQLFLYNWFIAPCICYLFHVGYLLILVVYVVLYHQLVLSWYFALYYCIVNVIPIALIVILAHIRERVENEMATETSLREDE